MEEYKEEKIFPNKKLASKEEKNNLINLRHTKIDDFAQKFEKDGPLKNDEKNHKEKSDKNFLDKIIEIGIYLLVFLMPIFILPFSLETYEFNKTFLLVSISGLLLVLWILNGFFFKKKFAVAKSAIILPFLVFIIAIIASALFGKDRFASFLGSYGNFSDSVIFYIGLLFFYFVSVNLIAEKGNRVVKNILKVSIISSFLVAVSALLYYFGIDSLSFIGKGMTGANLVGSDLRILAIYLSAMIFISLYDFTSSHKHDLPAKVFDFLAILLALVLLVLIGWNLAWLVFFAILLVSVLIGKFSSEKNMPRTAEF